MNHQGPQIPEDVNDSNLYRAYRLLLSVCETGVLSRACDRTGLSLPTASRLLARARTWFDDPLFVHSAGRMYPTVRMKALRPRLIEAMRATDALFNEENVFDPQSAEGVVRIVAIDNAFYTLLIPLIMEQGVAVLSFEHFRHEKASRRREAFSCVWAGVSMSFGRRRPSAA